MARNHFRQINPVCESTRTPLDKIQMLLSEADTGKATKSEQAIVVAYNMKKGMSEVEAYQKGQKV